MNNQINFKPKKVLIKGNDDILLNSKQIKKIEAFTASVTTSGAGKVRMVFSNDSGVTWKKYNPLTLAIEDVAILCGGINGCHQKLHNIVAKQHPENPYGREHIYSLDLLKNLP